MNDYILTYSKIHFTPLSPVAEDLSITDIAHSLSLMTRAGGHFPEFYSVAQHCIHCAEEAKARSLSPRLTLACLLHDAGEAYLADVTRPVKQYLPGFQEIENRLLDVIYAHFLGSRLTEEEACQVKEIDDTLLYHEFFHYTKEALLPQAPAMKSDPVFGFRDFKEVEQEYLQLFHELHT